MAKRKPSKSKSIKKGPKSNSKGKQPVEKSEKPGAQPPPKIKPEDASKLFQEMQKDKKCKSMLKKFLKPELFDKLMKEKTSMGSTLLDCIQSGLINHDSNIGVYAADPEAYKTFNELFNPIIEAYHGFKSNDKHPTSDFGDANKFINLDPSKSFIVSTRVRCGRNLKGFPFNPCMTEQNYKDLEKKMTDILAKIPDDDLKGEYLPLSGMSKQEQQKLIDQHFLFKEGDKFLKAGQACNYWPVGRGIFLNKFKNFMIWIGEEDHIRIISMQEGSDLKEIYSRLIKAMKYLNSTCEFVCDENLGFLTFCPTNLGSTVRASVMIKLEKLANNKRLLESTASKLNLQVRGSKGEHSDSPDGMYDISNKRRLGLTEFQAVMEMQKGALKLIEMEKNLKAL